jgi:hypothetical protein
MQGSKVLRRLFAPSAQPSHCEAMIEIMASNRAVPLYILADVLDQQYVPQTFPPVSSMSVGGLVKRRLDRDFQPDDFKGSLLLGRDKTGRKEWRYLLVALAKTPLMADWMDRVVDLPNEIKGVYLLPIEAVNYVGALNKKLATEKPRPWQLFISHNKVSGFRQVVIRDGKLAFTRVSQAIDDAIPAVIAGNIEQEIINTVEYLKRLEFRENSDLDATVIISQDVIDSLDLNRFGFASARALTPVDVAEALGLEQAALSADRFGDVVMAAGFAINKKQVLRFSNAYIDKLAKLYKLIVLARAFGAVCVVGISGLVVMSIVSMIGDYGSIAESKAAIKRVQPELEKTRKLVDSLNQDVAFKSAAVATYDAYIKDMPKPEDFILEVSKLIAPQARVVSIVWDNTASNRNAPSASATPGSEVLPIDIIMEVDFSGLGSTQDVVEKSAEAFTAEMKQKLPQYEVSHEPYPWQKAESQNTEIALELNIASAVTVSNPVVKYTLRGIRKVDSVPGATPTQVPQ